MQYLERVSRHHQGADTWIDSGSDVVEGERNSWRGPVWRDGPEGPRIICHCVIEGVVERGDNGEGIRVRVTAVAGDIAPERGELVEPSCSLLAGFGCWRTQWNDEQARSARLSSEDGAERSERRQPIRKREAHMVDFAVDVLWDEEAKVFVGTSGDIPGLTLEADRLGELLDAAFDTVPSLIEQNLSLPEGAEVLVTFRVRQPVRKSAPLGPRYLVEDDPRIPA